MDSHLTLAILMTLTGYLLGSISSAVLICRLFRLPDPRLHGSGNPGATNVLRLGGRIPATLVLLSDILKGTIPVWGGYLLGLSPWVLAAVGVAATLGHIYPLFFKMQGGKGVATALGAIAPIGWELLLALAITWFLVALVTRYSSLASICACSMAPLFTYLFKPQYTGAVAVLIALILWRHRANMIRLYRGTEPKLGAARSVGPKR
ncbi:glycerol-3-phosphate 1-O-acyltransferase PlsY [uncultured Ferrimonas sp.]|uniref:glycerol-3-phosphate 1-O-acyltransferase PlsY n=1 Tax=uncultured Ferrimonas sp. TaxID=432640 RepID=UPI00260F6629|nr:glycerol-3-phosphate 1-O-acyltransferase PlsY [uncultured Ferrimonas sp.]